MNKPCTLILVRHAETTGNTTEHPAKLDEPNHLFPLTKRGEAQAQWAHVYLLRTFQKWDACYASTFLRSQLTAQYFAIPPLSVRIDSRFDEHLAGIFHTLPRETVLKEFETEQLLREKYGWYHHRPTGGENVPDVEQRIRSVIRVLHERHAEQTIVVAGHGTWMQIFASVVHGFSPEKLLTYRKQNPIPNCCISVYHLLGGEEVETVAERVMWPKDSDYTQRDA